MLRIFQPGRFIEKEVDDRLDGWVQEVRQIKNPDGVSLNRRLVDAGY
jgi:hypothetical protein